MHTSLRLSISLLVFALVVGALIWRSQPQPPMQDNPSTVAATIFPLYDITQNIAGDALNVELVLPVGASPHTFEPTPSLLRNLDTASVVYAIGYEMDDWAFTVAKSVGADVQIVDAGIAIREGAQEDEPFDPHYWLSFENAMIITQTVADDLSIRFPESADIFQANAQSYIEELTDAQEQAQDIVSQEVESKNLITLHDAWYYFSDSLGLNIIGTFEPSAGREPTPQYLIELTQALTQTESTALYSEPQLDTTSLESFAADNQLTISILDPLGGDEGATTYIDMMLSNVQIIADNQ